MICAVLSFLLHLMPWDLLRCPQGTQIYYQPSLPEQASREWIRCTSLDPSLSRPVYPRTTWQAVYQFRQEWSWRWRCGRRTRTNAEEASSSCFAISMTLDARSGSSPASSTLRYPHSGEECLSVSLCSLRQSNLKSEGTCTSQADYSQLRCGER